MSFIVTGFDIPKNCWGCPFPCMGEKTDPKGGRPGHCPLRPLPEKHGDLIDRDAVPRFGNRKGLVHSLDLDAMPVIVGAEE